MYKRQTQTIDATIFASSHPDIAKRTSISGVLFSSFMLLVGILAFASTFELEETAKKVGGHGGMDFIMDYRLAYCLQNGLPLDLSLIHI